jgi:predicted nucleic acid-binding protein
MKHKSRFYADTSVYGGVFDEEFQKRSRSFFAQIESGIYTLVTSDLVRRELSEAPGPVQDHFHNILPYTELIEITDEAILLQQAYLNANIVTEKSLEDALHVALATVSGCNGIISWNFKHIVHFQKIPMYNAINVMNGYGEIMIYSPLEVIDYDNENF